MDSVDLVSVGVQQVTSDCAFGLVYPQDGALAVLTQLLWNVDLEPVADEEFWDHHTEMHVDVQVGSEGQCELVGEMLSHLNVVGCVYVGSDGCEEVSLIDRLHEVVMDASQGHWET